MTMRHLQTEEKVMMNPVTMMDGASETSNTVSETNWEDGGNDDSEGSSSLSSSRPAAVRSWIQKSNKRTTTRTKRQQQQTTSFRTFQRAASLLVVMACAMNSVYRIYLAASSHHHTAAAADGVLVLSSATIDTMMPSSQRHQDDSLVLPTTASRTSREELEGRITETTLTEQARSVPPPPLIRPLSPLAQTQAAHYRNHTGLMLNLHITHHGGTTFCTRVGHAINAVGSTPSFACWIPVDNHLPADYPAHDNPWPKEQTFQNLQAARQRFHMQSWEYMEPPATVPLKATNWEEERLFSVLVVRDPLKRLLAGDMMVASQYPGVIQGTANRSVVEAFAHNDTFTDNFALRILAGSDCCQGKDTDRKHLEAAKALVQRFSVVIDIECLDESLEALAQNAWNLQLPPRRPNARKIRAPPKERIGDDEIYNYLLEKNKLDIELYEWAKSLSYLDCSQVQSRTE